MYDLRFLTTTLGGAILLRLCPDAVILKARVVWGFLWFDSEDFVLGGGVDVDVAAPVGV